MQSAVVLLCAFLVAVVPSSSHVFITECLADIRCVLRQNNIEPPPANLTTEALTAAIGKCVSR